MNLSNLNEMSAILPNYVGKDRSQEFKDDYKYLKLVKSDIQPRNLKLFSFVNRFYLATDDNNYIGHIEFEAKLIDNKKCLFISEANSKKIYNIKGFYNLIFNIILSNTDFDIILNDEQESEKSITAWKKLKGTRLFFIILNQTENKFEKFNTDNEDDYWTLFSKDWKKYRVGVSADKILIKESHDEILKRELKRAEVRNSTYNARSIYRDEEYFRMEEIRFLGLNLDDYLP